MIRIAATMAGLAISSVLGSALAAPQGEIGGKITYYTHFSNFVNNGKWAEWTSAFEKKYPGTEVEVLAVANYRKEMPTRIASGDYGDVLNILDNLPPSDYPNFYAPLNDMSLAETHSFVDHYRVDGKIYGYVYGQNAESVIYNKKAFERAGIESVPTTRSELFAACDKLNDAGVTPFIINMGAGWPMQQWDKAALLFANDGDYYRDMLDDPTPYAAKQPYGQSVRFVKALFDAGCTERDYTANNWEQSQMELAAGEAAMWFLGNWTIPQIIAAGKSLGLENVGADLGMFPLPIDDSGDPAVLLTPDWAVGVSAKSDNKSTAKAWIEFLLTETDFAEAAGFIPGNTQQKSAMPQVNELLESNPRTIRLGKTNSDFKEAMADARIDFMTGTYIRDLLLADDFEAAIADLNRRWGDAIAE